MKKSDHHIETDCVHAGHGPDAATAAVSPPIYLSTTFERGPDGSYPKGFSYARVANPNRAQLESCLAVLEGGREALAFSSGVAAAMAVFQALKPGDQVLCTEDAYHGIRRLLREVLQPWRLQVRFVDSTDPAAVRKAITPTTRLLWVETPSNPLLRITDLAAMAEIAQHAQVLTVCDNTFATPVLQRPFDFGMDLVMHSATKYLGGHSDVMGGVIVARESNAFTERLRLLQSEAGAVPSPFDCWLILRGAATLHLRIRAQSHNAARIAEFLARHKAVEQVFYPGLAIHPGHALAARQMRGFGAVLSFTLRGGQAAAMRCVAGVKLFTRATSLGGVESLIEHRASMEGPDTSTPDNLVRASVGVEHADDLIADLDQAMASQ
ncbi:MAG: aminotransferase class V-fold PLP-dependent enzyme [Gammaproteobacteria bacterium]|nr:aminotransferase class V-fold PLP-dependent enzyme [Gammaproteobacteria bacterium]MDE2344961.1 aminotransferase class V-fold PLP-dependent enzyme [Gammaproteobacteria bacterium]